ncbi:hypothetical protein RB3809 [Rhodopirellula baltica SH 1]|uniref:Uncharacterized protein n=1 Tax=Rhodopirellula baltica (strain DSM 10527 / NCIMB 13988 / SH1) TaxID=243090 RepID=Q7UTL8_RHOBA|nr:hypothetical protein RB3809 [Rhodopirellula baltica SH 1]
MSLMLADGDSAKSPLGTNFLSSTFDENQSLDSGRQRERIKRAMTELVFRCL